MNHNEPCEFSVVSDLLPDSAVKRTAMPGHVHSANLMFDQAPFRLGGTAKGWMVHRLKLHPAKLQKTGSGEMPRYTKISKVEQFLCPNFSHHPTKKGIFHIQQIWLFWWCETNSQKGTFTIVYPCRIIHLPFPSVTWDDSQEKIEHSDSLTVRKSHLVCSPSKLWRSISGYHCWTL